MCKLSPVCVVHLATENGGCGAVLYSSAPPLLANIDENFVVVAVSV